MCLGVSLISSIDISPRKTSIYTYMYVHTFELHYIIGILRVIFISSSEQNWNITNHMAQSKH